MLTKPLSLRLLKIVLSLWWWGLIVGGILFVGFVATRNGDEIDFAMIGYASDIDTSALLAHDRDGKAWTVEFDDPVKVRLIADQPSGAATGRKVVSLAVITPMFILLLFFVKQLRDIVRTIDQQDPFAVENAGRVRTVGLLLLGYVLVECVARALMSGIADVMVVAEGFNLNGRIKINEGLLVAGLAIIVLSEVFRHGSRIREEQSLTV